MTLPSTLLAFAFVLFSFPQCGPGAGGPRCGDGALAAPETCDDGNITDGDGCSSTCALEPGVGSTCGDGSVQAGEQCDDGNADNSDGCDTDCRLPICGNGVQQAGEDCDDGNTDNGDGCSNSCTINNLNCGNGTLDAGEECDDGNGVHNDGCTNSCTEPVCGDGIVQVDEDCDDGNTSDGDVCPASCLVAGTCRDIDGDYTIGVGEGTDIGAQFCAEIVGTTCTFSVVNADGDTIGTGTGDTTSVTVVRDDDVSCSGAFNPPATLACDNSETLTFLEGCEVGDGACLWSTTDDDGNTGRQLCNNDDSLVCEDIPECDENDTQNGNGHCIETPTSPDGGGQPLIASDVQACQADTTGNAQPDSRCQDGGMDTDPLIVFYSGPEEVGVEVYCDMCQDAGGVATEDFCLISR